VTPGPVVAGAVVVVAGIPGSGKTTLARPLASALGLPLISKDTIKEALLDALGSGDLEWSRRLGRASHDVMYALVRDIGSVVLESHFWTGVSETNLTALRRPLVQVYCSCPLELAIARYEARISDPSRHPGHLPEHQSLDATIYWRSVEPSPLALDAPLIEVDTSGPVDVDALAGTVLAAVTQRTG
jgi:predicted kinase